MTRRVRAVRCEPATTRITADETYYRKARPLGGIVLLRDFQPQ